MQMRGVTDLLLKVRNSPLLIIKFRSNRI